MLAFYLRLDLPAALPAVDGQRALVLLLSSLLALPVVRPSACCCSMPPHAVRACHALPVIFT